MVEKPLLSLSSYVSAVQVLSLYIKVVKVKTDKKRVASQYTLQFFLKSTTNGILFDH